jgi:lysozyme
MASVADILKYQEGFSPKLYKCTAGKWTIGYGYNIEDNGLPEDICRTLLVREIVNVVRGLRENLDWYEELDDARKKALISMAYQLGVRGLLGFKNMLKALKEKNYELAYVEALDSRWAKQTPRRARSVAMVLRTGDESWFFKESA